MLTAVMFAPYPCALGPVPKLPWMRSNLLSTMVSLKIAQPCPVSDERDTFQSYMLGLVALYVAVGYQLVAPI